jgi:hypothetical protein
MSVLEAAIAVWLGGGLLAFSAWCIRIYVQSELGPHADWTSRLIWHTGRAVIWAAALLLGGGLFGAALATVWRLVRG